MIKIVGFLMIVTSTTLIGFFYADKFKKRLKQLKELQRGIYILKNEINFTRSLLPDAIYRAYEKCEPPIADMFFEISKLMREEEEVDVSYCFEKSIADNKAKLDLKQDDISIIMDLGKSLGEMDVEGHNDILGLALSNLDKALINAEENMDKNVKMYRYLGFSAGMMIGIILM